MEDTMCTRLEVQEIVDRHSHEIHRDIVAQISSLKGDVTSMRADLDRDMHTVAREEVQKAKEGITRFVGWGGILTIGSAFWFFSGLQADVRYLQAETEKTNNKLEEFEKFMNSGDRFTAIDGGELKGYVDQQDKYILQKVEDGFETISEQITRLHKE